MILLFIIPILIFNKYLSVAAPITAKTTTTSLKTTMKTTAKATTSQTTTTLNPLDLQLHNGK